MEPIVVRFFKRTHARMLHRSVQVEEDNATGYRRLSVQYAVKSRDTGKRINMPGFGSSRVMESAGIDRNYVVVRINGESLHALPTNREAINEYVRRLRTDDAAALVAHDYQIEKLTAQLRAARAARIDHLHESFKRARTVTVKELVALAEQPR